MERVNRRTALRALGVGLGGALAGCLGDGPGGPEPPGNPGDGTDRTDSPTDTPRTGDGAVSEYEVRPFGVSSSGGEWFGEDRATGHVELYGSAGAARGLLALGEVPDDRRGRLESFVDGTDFDRARLLYVVSAGPDTCHGRLEVSDLGTAEDALAGEARVVDEREANQGCGDAVTFPSALVRVRFDAAPANRATLSVTDGWDQTGEVSATAVAVDPGSLAGHVRPAGDPSAVPSALECEESGFTRHPAGFSGRPPWGASTTDGGAFALRVDSLAANPGDAVTVTLTNVGAETHYTGNRHKYDLQVLTGAGWEDVRGSTGRDSFPYTDEAVAHEPGEGFEWSFELTPEGVVQGHFHGEDLEVCPGLPAGRYRFVFWEPTVAVAFDLESG